MDRHGDTITRNGTFTRIATTSKRATKAVPSPTELHTTKIRAEQQCGNMVNNNSSVRAQVQSDGFFASARGSIDNHLRTAQQKILHFEQYRCNGQRARSASTHQMTPAKKDQSTYLPTPPPLLYVSRKQQSLGSRGSRMFADNSLGGYTHLRGKEERHKVTFEKMQFYRKVLNKACPPPPLVKSCVKDLSRDPPASLFGEANKAAPIPSSKFPMKERAPVVTRDPFAGVNKNYTQTSSDILITGITDRANNQLGAKQHCSSVSTNLVMPRSHKRCSSVPCIPASNTLHKQAKMSSTLAQSYPSRRHSSLDIQSVETPLVPASRRLETNGSESCGGFAYDHDSMPKIVAVHSVTWKESESESLQCEGFPLVERHRESSTTKSQEKKTKPDDNLHPHTQLNATVADCGRFHQINRPFCETERRGVELSWDEMANGYSVTRQRGKGTQSAGATHRRHDDYRPLRALELVNAEVSNETKQHEIVDLTSVSCGGEILSRYTHARAEQASARHQADTPSNNHVDTNITLERRQAHSAPYNQPGSIHMFSRTQLTAQQCIVNGNSDITKFLLLGNDACKTTIQSHKPKLPSPNAMQYKTDREGRVAKRVRSVATSPQTEKITEDKKTMPTTDKLDELCRKILETRERSEQETIKWKKKLLRSLEIVFIKRLRKVERDTGQKADIAITFPEE